MVDNMAINQIELLKSNGEPVDSLMLMITYSCQFDCKYCEIKRSDLTMDKEIMFRDIDLLFTSKSSRLQLRFFGGEPLLKFDMLREAILYAERMGRQKNKKIKYMITTNGLSLDKDKIDFLSRFDTVVMFSIDGTKKTQRKYRPLKYNNKGAYEIIVKNLELLKQSGLNYFVNMVVEPSNIDNLLKDLNYLINLGVKKIQFCYRVGVYWKMKEIDRMIKALSSFMQRIKRRKINFTFQNFSSNCEPVMLSQEIIADVDGQVYFDAAIFVERRFPQLKKYYRLGNVNELNNICNLTKTKRELYHIFKEALKGNSRLESIFLNNINLGLKLADFFEKHKKLIENNEHPLFTEFIKNDFLYQKKFIKEHKLGTDSVFLYINSECLNDCIFCKRKKEPHEPIKKIKFKIIKNLKTKSRKISLIGNEPLLHPNIINILKLCKKYGFKEIEVMTSGTLLRDSKFTDSLIENGMTSFSIPIFSKNPKIHDNITQVNGSLEDVLKGIKNIEKYENIKIYIHSNLLKQNVNEMNKLERFIKNELNLPFCIMPIRPKSSNLDYSELIPTYSDMVDKLREVKSLVGFPLCVIKEIQDKLLIETDQISDSNKIYFLDQNFVKPKKCSTCSIFKKCAGTFQEYIRLNGTRELKPLGRKR